MKVAVLLFLFPLPFTLAWLNAPRAAANARFFFGLAIIRLFLSSRSSGNFKWILFRSSSYDLISIIIMTQIRAVFCVCIRWHDWRRENCFLLGIMWCQKKMQWDVIKRPQHVIRMNRCKQRRVLWARFLNAEKLFLHTAKHWSCQLIITKMTTTICRRVSARRQCLIFRVDESRFHSRWMRSYIDSIGVQYQFSAQNSAMDGIWNVHQLHVRIKSKLIDVVISVMSRAI